MKKPLTRFLVFALMLSLATTDLRAQAAVVLPGLSVSGAHIVANGVPVRLRGVSVGDSFWARNTSWYPSLSLNDYSKLSRHWYANVVRISVFPTQWKHMDHAQLLDGLAKQVNAALSNGMYVIISYHVIGWPDGYYEPPPAGSPADIYDSSMWLAKSFWRQMSLSYGSDRRILFDLWNEPVNIADLTTGPSDPNPLWPVLRSYYVTLLQIVRSNGAQNIVIATGNYWASWLAGIKDNPLPDANVVYAYHKYSEPGENTASVWNRGTGGLIGVKPVIVSEWGYEDADAGPDPQWPGSAASYGIPFTNWLEQNRLSNLAWIYHYDWTPAMLKSDGSLTLYGKFVRSYIASHNAPKTTAAFRSIAAHDGWVLESSENSSLGGLVNVGGPASRLGDDAANRQYRSLLSFDTSSLPDNAAITAVTLKVRRAGMTGSNPFSTLGNIAVDIRKGAFSNDASLQGSDFHAAASRDAALAIGNNPANGWYSRSMSSSFFSYINLTGVTQFRLRFVKDDNNNGVADYLRFYSGDFAITPSYRPALIVQYYLP